MRGEKGDERDLNRNPNHKEMFKERDDRRRLMIQDKRRRETSSL
jgi:hypothetical protein